MLFNKRISVVERNKLDKTLSGLKAGLQNSKSLQEEVQELRKREKSQLNMVINLPFYEKLFKYCFVIALDF